MTKQITNLQIFTPLITSSFRLGLLLQNSKDKPNPPLFICNVNVILKITSQNTQPSVGKRQRGKK